MKQLDEIHFKTVTKVPIFGDPQEIVEVHGIMVGAFFGDLRKDKLGEIKYDFTDSKYIFKTGFQILSLSENSMRKVLEKIDKLKKTKGNR